MDIKRFISCVIVLAVFLTGSYSVIAQDHAKIPSDKPGIIIGLVIGQMRQDYLFRYWNKFGNDGFKKLINEGTFCKNARFNYLFSQQGVGHATIATGTNPSDHGIIGKEWYASLPDKTVYSTLDDGVETVGGSYDAGRMSPSNLMSSTFADELKLSNNFRSKVFAVSLSPASVVFSAGHTANGAYWFDDVSGNFVTSSYYVDTLPVWAREVNSKNLADTYLDREWNTLLTIDKYTESLPDKNGYETGIKGVTTFPYDLSGLSKLKGKKRDYSMIRKVPFGNNLVKDFATSLIINEQLGDDEHTDIIIIGFDAMEQIGNLYGPHSVEVEDAFLRLDRDIAHFLKFIDENIGKENALVFLTAEHGVSYVPDFLNDVSIPAGYFNYNSALSLLGSYLNVLYGQGDWFKSYHAQQIYLNRRLIEDARIPLPEIQDVVSQFMLQFTGVVNTISAHTLQTTWFSEGIFEKIQNGYNQKRSGDVIINLRSGWVEKNGASTNHSSSYTYDTRVPLIWYGWKVGRGTVSREVDLIDIAPTISTFLNIAYPNTCTGRTIQELVK